MYKEIPDKIKNTKSVINIKNLKDDECFRWCIMCNDYPRDKDAQRIKDLQKIKKENPKLYNFDGLTFPVKISDIPRFEKLNNKFINVYECNHKGVLSILHTSKDPNNDKKN